MRICGAAVKLLIYRIKAICHPVDFDRVTIVCCLIPNRLAAAVFFGAFSGEVVRESPNWSNVKFLWISALSFGRKYM